MAENLSSGINRVAITGWLAALSLCPITLVSLNVVGLQVYPSLSFDIVRSQDAAGSRRIEPSTRAHQNSAPAPTERAAPVEISLATPNQTVRSSGFGGAIASPAANTIVGAEIPVDGWVGTDVEHAWLFVRRGGLVWAKEPRLEPSAGSGAFSGSVFEGGPSGDLEIVLAAVSIVGDQALRGWLSRGKQTGQNPGLRTSTIDGFSEIDAMPYRFRR